MMISEAAIKALSTIEGIAEKAYLDVAGKLTVGVGHLITPMDINLERVTGKPAESFRVGTQISIEEVAELLHLDLHRFEVAIDDLVEVSLSQWEFDALVLFVFNVGVEAFRKSTMLKLINADAFDKAALEFARWTIAGGKKVAGLINRRALEKQMFIYPEISLDKEPFVKDSDRKFITKVVLDYRKAVVGE